MMRGFEAPHGGLVLFTTPSRRQRSVRRRWLALSVILGVALAGGVIGQMSANRGDASRPVPPGPLSYLPQ
jgi:hypothetical protein